MKNTFINKYYKNEYKELIKTLNNDAKTFTAGYSINLNYILDVIENEENEIKGVLNRKNLLSFCFEISDGNETKYYTVNAGRCKTRTFKEYLYDIKTYNEFFNEQIEMTKEQLIKIIKFNLKYKIYEDMKRKEETI